MFLSLSLCDVSVMMMEESAQSDLILNASPVYFRARDIHTFNQTGNSQATPCFDEYSCLAARLSEAERLNLEAIRTLHGKLDDDANGNIDLSESDEVRKQEFLHFFKLGIDRRADINSKNGNPLVATERLSAGCQISLALGIFETDLKGIRY